MDAPHVDDESRVRSSQARQAGNPKTQPGGEREGDRVENSEGRGSPEHRYLQSLIRTWAQERGYRAEIEVELPGGGRVDLVVSPNAESESPREPETSVEDERVVQSSGVERIAAEQIAVEISISTSHEHELVNARKCLDAGFAHVALISPRTQFQAVLARSVGELESAGQQRVEVYAPEEFLAYLQSLPRSTNRVAGYQVTTKASGGSGKSNADERRRRLNQVIAGSLKRMRQKDEEAK